MAASNDGKLDPTVSCPKLHEFAELDPEILSYLLANKNWCGIPDEMITATHADLNCASNLAQACEHAAEMKKERSVKNEHLVMKRQVSLNRRRLSPTAKAPLSGRTSGSAS